MVLLTLPQDCWIINKTSHLTPGNEPHEPGGDEVERRRRRAGAVHVADQLGQPILPLDVRLRLQG